MSFVSRNLCVSAGGSILLIRLQQHVSELEQCINADRMPPTKQRQMVASFKEKYSCMNYVNGRRFVHIIRLIKSELMIMNSKVKFDDFVRVVCRTK